MARFNEVGRALDLAFGDTINDNFTTADTELTRIDGRATTEDSRLQGEIDTKASESIARDDSLGVRVDNIVAGNTTTDASIINEVVDSRLGADGTVRASLGELIREIHDKLTFTDEDTNTNYTYRLKQKDGHVIFVYEEVL